MLEKHRRPRLGHEGQDPPLRALAELERPGEAGSFGTGNLLPAQDQGGVAEPGAGQGGPTDGSGNITQGGRTAALRGRRVQLFSLAALRHGPTMPLETPARKLLRWYDRHARVLPWRARRGERADPYRVWLSEIMLQQTTVQAVAGYFRTFVSRWPTVNSLAAASLDDVLTAWAGLGYYARARNLHKAAQIVAQEHAGRFPDTYESLRALPGIGVYTAGAIAAIAYDLPHAAMDANAERVVARLFAVREPMPKAKARLRASGQSLVPQRRAGDFAQAMMDLGATICMPKRPACLNCPLRDDCRARKQRIQETLPVKAAKAQRPVKRGAAFVVRDLDGAILLVKRPPTGLLASMMQPPLGPWTNDFPTRAQALKQAPFTAAWKKRIGIVRHGFTHFELEVEVYEATLARRPNVEGRWVCDLSSAALPTVMRKIIGAGPRRR